MLALRVMILVSFGLALFAFGYGDAVMRLIDPLVRVKSADGKEHEMLRLPGLVLGTLPVFVAMIGLWWAAYPIERGHREAYAQDLFEQDLPVHMPPSVGKYLWLNVRMQLLLTATPVFAGLFVSDVSSVILRALEIPAGQGVSLLMFLITLGVVFILSPWLLTLVLDAEKMPDTPLRRRLETLAARLNVRCRDVLIWRTGHSVGNAMVIGLVPRIRYILLTDLLIETLSDRQIEAVFAHEVGHIRHRHIAWYLVMIAAFLVALAGPIALLSQWVYNRFGWSDDLSSFVVGLPFFIAFIVIFGIVSRIFERQADAFASRTLQTDEPEPPIEPATEYASPSVQPSGAETFSSALRRVAQINHMPVHDPPRGKTWIARLRQRLVYQFAHFRHPSIQRRIESVKHLAAHPEHSARFDRRVSNIMLLLLAILVALAGITLAGISLMR